ncbi:hypothetical protein AB4490_10565 [Vibrio cyclitrophicus]|uniref:hypothetical protein n=1 Tax=Vibrio cyclitrophicus TaxID=47951 RepID=UPI0011B4E01C|nr:hypothetical protein [Vibrio cyclitrophicus]
MFLDFKELYLPIIMTIYLGYIAYEQLRTNRDKLKLDLYNKRFEVYAVTLTFYQDLMSQGASQELHRKFIEVKQSSKFLFDPKDEIYTSLSKINIESFKVKACKEAEGLGNDLMFQLHQDSHAALGIIVKELEQLDIKMSKYLCFKK